MIVYKINVILYGERRKKHTWKIVHLGRALFLYIKYIISI